MFKKEIHIPNEINDIVTAMTQEFVISSISESGTTSTITTPSVRIFDNLSEIILLTTGMVITINSKNYIVSNIVLLVGSATFDITATGLTATKWNVAASFKFGSRKEINQALQEETNNDSKFKRFPLIWLFTPIEKDYDNTAIDFEAQIILSLAYKSNKTDRAQIRLDGNIKIILQPLLRLFLAYCKSSDFNYMFEFEGYGKPINYESQDFYFYGTSDKTKEVLNTSTDAIEITFNLKFKKQFDY